MEEGRRLGKYTTEGGIVKRSQKVALAAAADSLSKELKSLGLPLRYKRKKNFERMER